MKRPSRLGMGIWGGLAALGVVATIVLLPMASAVTLNPNWQHANLTIPINYGTSAYQNTWSTNTPTVVGNWITWAQTSGPNTAWAHLEVDGGWFVNIPSGASWGGVSAIPAGGGSGAISNRLAVRFRRELAC